VIKALRAANGVYEDKVAFVNVNWDTHRRSRISKDLRIPRQATLVVLTGEGEIGRLVAETRKAAIKGLLDKALATARAGDATSCSG
jgi:hypothetical protein